MSALQEESRAFCRAKKLLVAEARQQAAFFLMCGVDLAVALGTSGEERAAILVRVNRLLERERLKGARRHWSYDLNRHIALKQAYERLKEGVPEVQLGAVRRLSRRWRSQHEKSGAGRRRSIS